MLLVLYNYSTNRVISTENEHVKGSHQLPLGGDSFYTAVYSAFYIFFLFCISTIWAHNGEARIYPRRIKKNFSTRQEI